MLHCIDELCYTIKPSLWTADDMTCSRFERLQYWLEGSRFKILASRDEYFLNKEHMVSCPSKAEQTNSQRWTGQADT